MSPYSIGGRGMIFTKIIRQMTKEEADQTNKELETIYLQPEELSKSILCVTSDEGNEYGIRLDEGTLQSGAVLFEDEDSILWIQTIPQRMIVITPKDINEMGKIAHMLGNMHKPVAVFSGKIMLEEDSVVKRLLNEKGIAFTEEEVSLSEPLQYANLAHHHNHEGHHHE